ncbi:MAG: aryl-sulfate sulfotransferase, partial [Desulfobacterales bacterium]|nr:aryl-sulfate sulfotransferase [Desulfobacterales bacterium]
MSYPSVYPTGTTIYDPEKSFNGYTVFQAMEQGILVIDMNGGEIRFFKNMHGFPAKILPGGYVMGSTGERNTKFSTQDKCDVIQVDWDGNIVWKFDQYEYIEDPGEEPRWMARQHHDYQREGNPVGYYTPELTPSVDKGNTMILGHRNTTMKETGAINLLDDVIYEVNWEGDIVWEWCLSDHIKDLGFKEEALNILHRNPNIRPAGGGIGDWMHTNSMSLLGPNPHFDAGDERFHPDNIIICGRETNISLIISKETGKIVWRLGPDYDTSPELKKLGWIIGQHHAHMIPKGLPGAGNIMIFDNGGWAGYGAPNPLSPTGFRSALRDYSRVIEIDPVTLEIKWQFSPGELGLVFPVDYNRFYSPFVSSAQRLPNGNTLITEGASGKIFEVTRDHEIVWEYIS